MQFRTSTLGMALAVCWWSYAMALADDPAAPTAASVAPTKAERPQHFAPPTANRITTGALDALVAKELPVDAQPPLSSDEAFLRRTSFDLLGRQPTLAEQQQFAADSSPDKRQQLVERLLASEEFGVNWANYWSDAIAYRVPPPELTYLDYRPLKGWLAGKLNGNASWNEIVRELITASGKVADVPAATFVGYHQANAGNLAAETSRIFLGQQILCAQCHDHPFDHWKRTQFHSLAAFFARTKAKLPWNVGPDTVVSSAEKGEYRMPDMTDSSKPGSKMDPVFLDADVILAGHNGKVGKDDAERRGRLADFVTAKDNPWFAKAYTNRVWAQLMGQGFFEPVDDLGDSRSQQWPAVHEALAGHFLATDYNVKDLFRLIMTTEAYARGVKTGATSAQAPAAAEVAPGQPLRLRGDEVFAALRAGVDLPNKTPAAVAPTAAIRFPPPPASTQDLINAAFGTDPSLSAADAPRTMQQALWMMNNEQLQAAINAAPGAGTMLSKLLDDVSDDKTVCERLYARVLARRPTADETRIALAHVAELKDRRAGFEDVLWSLVNTAEFTSRR